MVGRRMRVCAIGVPVRWSVCGRGGRRLGCIAVIGGSAPRVAFGAGCEAGARSAAPRVALKLATGASGSGSSCTTASAVNGTKKGVSPSSSIVTASASVGPGIEVCAGYVAALVRERRDPRPRPRRELLATSRRSPSRKRLARSRSCAPQSALPRRATWPDNKLNPNETISRKIAAVRLEARRQEGGREHRARRERRGPSSG